MSTLAEQILNSPGIQSLRLETDVYDQFKKQGWDASHAPYYQDLKTGKFREMDVTARKLFTHPTMKSLSCDVLFIAECKSMKDCHIVASNRFDDERYIGKRLVEIQLGDDSYSAYKRLSQLLRKYAFSDQDVKQILQAVEAKCFPGQFNFFNDYRVTAFALPVYNSFRETNIGNTKDLDSSVVWRAFQSISSCIETYQELPWIDIDFGLSEIDFKNPPDKMTEVIDYLLICSQSVKFIHPVLIVESTLWGLTDALPEQLKYLRLVFQKIYEPEMWMDVVNVNHFEEYIGKAQYDKFLTNKGFKH